MNKKTFFTLIALTALSSLSIDMYIPSLPSIAKQYNTYKSLTQITITIFLIGYSAALLFIGVLSDLYGRKKVLLAGLMIYSVSTAACYFSISIEFLIFSRFFQGFGASVGPTISRTIVRDLTRGKKTNVLISIISTTVSIVPIIAPIIGGFIDRYLDWKLNFLFMLVYAVMTIFTATFFIKETMFHPAGNTPNFKENIINLFKNRSFISSSSSVALTYSTVLSFVLVCPFIFINRFKFSSDKFGLLFGLFVVSYMIGTSLSGKLVSFFNEKKLLQFGYLIQLTCGVSLLLLNLHYAGYMQFLLFFLIFNIGSGIVFPTSISLALKSTDNFIGTASSMVGFIQMSFSSLILSLINSLFEPSVELIGIVFILFSLVNLAIQYAAQAPSAKKVAAIAREHYND